MKKIALLLADGFEEIEALGTTDILRRAGLSVETVSIKNDREVTGAHGIKVLADNIFADADLSNLSMVILPGGMPGAQHLNDHSGVRELLIDMNREKRWVAAICAAPMVLGGLGFLKDRKATCYPGFEEKLTGATTTAGNVEVDGHIVTGKGPGLMFDFALTLIEQLLGAEKREEVQQGLLW